jgi:phospho-N-acetylmuramoyl-pentapeptide-transferase
MLYHLIYPLHEYVSGLNVFRYITFRTAIAVLISLAIFVFFGKLVIRLLAKWTGKAMRPDTPEAHRKKVGTPSMGGILIVASVVVSILITGNLTNPNVLLCLAALMGYGILGFFDDYLKEVRKDGKGVSGKVKMAFQVLLAVTLVSYIIYGNPNRYLFFNAPIPDLKTFEVSIPFLTYSHLNFGWLYAPFAVFILVAASNAVNLTDGLDGLAIGLTLFVVIAYTGIAYLSGHHNMAHYLRIPFIPQIGEITVFTGALAGACLGFLLFNSHPAQVFMGDTGSLALGGVLGMLALLLKQEILLGIIGGVFVIETLSVIIQVWSFRIRKKRVFKMAPLHHHFELSGWHENKIIIRFWVAGAVLALFALATLKLR